jgi:hypothetical protein
VLEHDLIPESPDRRTWARITTFESQISEDVEAALRVVVDEVIPRSRVLPGWKGALALATEGRERGLVITLWDSVENMVSSGRSMSRELRGAGETAGLEVARGVERFEVVLEELPEPEPDG